MDKEKKSLIDYLNLVKDPRRKQGQRYSLLQILLILIMGTISGYSGYRELESFAKANRKEITELLGIKKDRVPSYVTIREVLIQIDFNSLNDAFQLWAEGLIDPKKQNGQWLTLDGKSIKSTMKDYSSKYQNFTSMVSLFSQSLGEVLAAKPFENKEQSEITIVRQMIENLGIKGAILTMDALHAKKKHWS
jgi:hypothetical protein